MRTALPLLLLGCLTAPVVAQRTEDQRIEMDYADFGRGVAVGGRWAVVGRDLTGGGGSPFVTYAVVYRYEPFLDQWVHEQDLPLDNGLDNLAHWGYYASIHGDAMAVGWHREDIGIVEGGVRVYRYDPTASPGTRWQLEQSFPIPDDWDPGFIWFGHAVALSDGVLAVGGPREAEGPLVNVGAVWIYVYDEASSSWTRIQKLEPTTLGSTTQSAHFGFSLALENVCGDDLLFVGAPGGRDPSDATTGTVHVFRWDDDLASFLLDRILYPSDGSNDDSFGGDLAVHAGQLLIGAPRQDDPLDANNLDSGAAYLFHSTIGGEDWLEVQKLTPPTPGRFDEFGASVDLAGELAVVAAEQRGRVGPGYAIAYHDDGTRWNALDVLVASDPHPENRSFFGTSVAVERTPGRSRLHRVLVGAPSDGTYDRGAVYSYLFDRFDLPRGRLRLFGCYVDPDLGVLLPLEVDEDAPIAPQVEAILGEVRRRR